MTATSPADTSSSLPQNSQAAPVLSELAKSSNTIAAITLLLLFTDALALITSVVIPFVFQQVVLSEQVDLRACQISLLVVPFSIVAFWSLRLYYGCVANPTREVPRILTAVTVAFVIAASCCLFYTNDTTSIWPRFFPISWIVAMVLTVVYRDIAKTLCSRLRWRSSPTVIVDAEREVYSLLPILKTNLSSVLRPFVAVDNDLRTAALHHSNPDIAGGNPPLLRTTTDIPRGRQAAIALPDSDRTVDFSCEALAAVAQPVPRAIKRLADGVLALTALVLIAPLMIVIAALVYSQSPGPVFYGQRRVGRYGQSFTAWKVRSMVVNAESVLEAYLASNPHLHAEWNCNHKLKKDPRITAIGRILRKTSLDELPQIWNVLCGDMSLVGPRPIVMEEIPKYAERFEAYKLVRPGITGLWQISGRNNTTYEERTQFDEYYVRNWSIWFDLYILARTIKTVLLGEGAY